MVTCAASCAVLPIQQAWARAFHLYASEKTAIDRITETDHLAAARNSAQDPFAYSVVETLRDGGRAVETGKLFDTQTRNRFADDPDAAVFCAFDATTGDWRRLGRRNTPRFREVVDRPLQNSKVWRTGCTSDRLAISEAVQDHPNRALRRLALPEFDRAAGRPRARTLGASSTALIRIDRPDGVVRLEQGLLSDATQPLDKGNK